MQRTTSQTRHPQDSRLTDQALRFTYSHGVVLEIVIVKQKHRVDIKQHLFDQIQHQVYNTVSNIEYLYVFEALVLWYGLERLVFDWYRSLRTRNKRTNNRLGHQLKVLVIGLINPFQKVLMVPPRCVHVTLTLAVPVFECWYSRVLCVLSDKNKSELVFKYFLTMRVKSDYTYSSESQHCQVVLNWSSARNIDIDVCSTHWPHLRCWPQNQYSIEEHFLLSNISIWTNIALESSWIPIEVCMLWM